MTADPPYIIENWLFLTKDFKSGPTFPISRSSPEKIAFSWAKLNRFWSDPPEMGDFSCFRPKLGPPAPNKGSYTHCTVGWHVPVHSGTPCHGWNVLQIPFWVRKGVRIGLYAPQNQSIYDFNNPCATDMTTKTLVFGRTMGWHIPMHSETHVMVGMSSKCHSGSKNGPK